MPRPSSKKRPSSKTASSKAGLPHRWDLSIDEARHLQEALAAHIVETDDYGPVHFVAGADISFDKASPTLFAAVVVWDVKTRRVVEISGVEKETTFPYIPGYLSFREIPPLLEAFKRLEVTPDLIVCDGQGRAHPRRFGIACHLGLWLNIPSIGCGKTRLIGEHREPGPKRGSFTQLRDKGELIGEVVRTRDKVKPLYVSVGHRVSQVAARRWILKLARTYRQPEVIRAAHNEVNRMRRASHKEEETH